MDVINAIGADLSQLPDPFMFFSSVGISGAVHPLMLLVASLETAKPDEKILCVGYGNGCDVFYVTTTEEVEKLKGTRRATSTYINSKRMLPNYEKYLDFKKLREKAKAEYPRGSVTAYWRDEKSILPFYGMKCKKCGTISYPISRCCVACGEKDNYDEVKLAKRGRIYTFTFDYLAGPGGAFGEYAALNPAIRIVVDLEDGCRTFLEMTDCEPKPEEVTIDMPVELTFRLISERSNFKFYGWRGRPVRG
jgi:uncharacterized OB-fold protein